MLRPYTFGALLRTAVALMMLWVLTASPVVAHSTPPVQRVAIPDVVTALPQQPLAVPALQQPTGDPWIGDITLGYDPNGADAVGDGGTLPLRADGGLVYAGFAWRNVRPGAMVSLERVFEEYPPETVSGRLPNTEGQMRIPVLRYTVPRGVWASTWIRITIRMDGNQMARAYVMLK